MEHDIIGSGEQISKVWGSVREIQLLQWLKFLISQAGWLEEIGE